MKNPKIVIQKHIYISITIAALFQNSQYLEAVKVPMPISRMDKTAIVHLHNGMLHSHMKEENLTFYKSMGTAGDYYAK